MTVTIPASPFDDAASRFHVLDTSDQWCYEWQPVVPFPNLPFGPADVAVGRLEVYSGGFPAVDHLINYAGVRAPGASRTVIDTARLNIPLGMGPGPWVISLTCAYAIKRAVPFTSNVAVLTGFIP